MTDRMIRLAVRALVAMAIVIVFAWLIAKVY